MSTLVSVIIPCYNQARFLAEAIESVLAQDHSEKEVIVINDGSPDNTREVASRFTDRIVYLEQENGGVSSARNKGITTARGDYIAFLDSDDIYLPHSLHHLCSFLDDHPDTGLVCGDVILFDEQGTTNLKSSVSETPKKPSNFRWETVGYYPTLSTVAVRRSCLDKAGFFEETLKSGGEDWLMWVRLSLYFNMAYLDHPIVRYRFHGMNATANMERLNAQNREASALAVKDPRFSGYPAHFRARLLYYRFATAWRSEPIGSALGFLIRAFSTDPGQSLYGMKVIRQGITNTLHRLRKRFG